MYLLTECCAAAAAEALVRAAPRGRRYDEAARDRLAQQVEEWFLQEPADKLLALLRPVGPAARSRLAAARRFVAERALAAWVRHQNVDKGFAPLTRQLHVAMDTAYGEQQPLDDLQDPPVATARGDGAARMWAWRWRRRWGARLGKVRPREDRAKRRWRGRPMRPQKDPLWDPKRTPIWYPKTAPLFGFKNASPVTAETRGRVFETKMVSKTRLRFERKRDPT